MRKLFTSIIFVGISILVLVSFPLLFINAEGGTIKIPNPLSSETFGDLLDKLVDFIFFVGIAVAPIMVLIAGFYFLTAGGDPKKVDTAKKIILYTIIGFAIILMARGLIGIINQILGVQQPGT